jgi:hypothetical protein
MKLRGLRQPSIEAGKSLFRTLRADVAAGRHRQLSARGWASVGMYLDSIEKQKRKERVEDKEPSPPARRRKRKTGAATR